MMQCAARKEDILSIKYGYFFFLSLDIIKLTIMSDLLVQSASNDELGYRVLFIVDATGSMGVFLNSLTISLYQVSSIMKLTTQNKSEVGILCK